MNPKSDLKALIPLILEKFTSNGHKIGESCCYLSEDGWGQSNESVTNFFYYEEDGWYIEVEYECCGEWAYYEGDNWTPSSRSLKEVWGEITKIYAYHYDETTDKETEFSEDELNELWSALDQALEKIS